MTRRKTRVKRINVGRQRRVSATAALALKREFEQLLDGGKLFRFIGRDERGRGFTMYSTHMDAEFLSTQLESIVRGCCFMSAAMRIWHKNFSAEELSSLRQVVDWMEDAYEPEPSIEVPDVVGERLNKLCRRANAVIESRGYFLQGDECERLPPHLNKQCQCTCSATGVWMGEEPGVTYA